MNKTTYLAHWYYSDHSASGILPRVLSEQEVALLKLAEEHFGFDKIVVFIPVEVTSPK